MSVATVYQILSLVCVDVLGKAAGRLGCRAELMLSDDRTERRETAGVGQVGGAAM